MITKQQVASAMAHECDVCKHLHGKLAPGSLDYRPTPGQRSTVELLRYLAVCGIAGTRCMAENNWKMFGDFTARVKDMPAGEFPAAMDRQKAELQEFFAAVSDEALLNQPAPLPGGGLQPLGAAILMGPFRWLAAYKLQLFLYAKATGAADIGTANAWAGVDRRP